MGRRWFAFAGVILGCLLIVPAEGRLAAQITPLCVSGCGGIVVSATPPSVVPAANTSGLIANYTIENQSSSVVFLTGPTCIRTGSVASCGSISIANPDLGPGDATTATVQYATGAAGAGTLQLKVLYTGNNSSGYLTVTAVAPGAPVVASLPRNRPDQLERGLCLTAGAGEAAVQCGDLIVAHAMPAYTTLGRNRSLTLVYNSATAAPRPTVAVTVTAPLYVLPPPSVVAELWVGPVGSQVLRASATYTKWGTGETADSRQIALSYDASADPTGIYDYKVVVKNNYTVAQSASMTGKLIVVNRSGSRFGRGWALAGVERIFPVVTGPILWVAGDGSARAYAQLNDSTWVAPTAAYQDTLRKSGTPAVYTRTLRHGVRVTYDASGRHVATTNRAMQITTFAWGGGAGDSLVSIAVPPVGTGGSYQVVYDGTSSGKVDKLRDPGPGGGRVLDLTINASTGLLTPLADPDGKSVSFDYDPTTRQMTSRTNRQGYPTTFWYGPSLKVDSVKVPYGAQGTTPAMTVFQPWDEKGLAVGTGGINKLAVDTTQVFTRILGPRGPNIADDATFYVDRWGAPSKTVDPMGATTKIERAQNKYPALVSRVTYPNNRIVRMYYDSTGATCCRGNLVEIRDSTSHLSNGLPTKSTRYTYETGTPDAPTLVTDAMNRTMKYAYTGLGMVDSAIDARGHVTKFIYDSVAGASLRGTVLQVIERSVQTWEEQADTVDDNSTTDSLRDHVTRYGYDAMGNIDSVSAPHGAVTSYAYDGYGRAYRSWDAFGMMTELVIDSLNRVTEQRQYTSPQANPFGTTIATMALDLKQVLAGDSSRTFMPALPSMISAFTQYADTSMDVAGPLDPTAKRHYSYDARYSVLKERDALQSTTGRVLDAAGLLTSVTARTGETVTYTYDNAGRRLTMSYPSRIVNDSVIAGDVVTNTYDPLTGDQLTASNKEGTTVRTYYADGSVRSRIFTRPGSTVLADTLRYSYNAAGQRTQLTHGPDVTTYTYDLTTGDLSSMSVSYGAGVNLTRTIAFVWDNLGRRRQITYPSLGNGNLIVSYRYDKLGVVRRVKAVHPNNLNLSFTYIADGVDAAGKILNQKRICNPGTSGQGPGPSGLCGGEIIYNPVTQSRYNRLGMMVSSGQPGQLDSMQYDAAGNLSARRAPGVGESWHLLSVDPKTNRLLSDAWDGQASTFTYDANGARRLEVTGTGAIERSYYYDALGRINGFNYRQWNGANVWQMTGGPNRCAYDADGQMIDVCDNWAPLIVYDGPNVVGTLNTQAVGIWTFTQGPGLDDPLIGLERRGTSVYELAWVTDGKGRQYAVGTLASAQDPSMSSYGNMDVGGQSGFWGWQWVGGTKRSYGFSSSRQSTSTSSAPDKTPEFAVFRNRLYDPRTGRWTQEDPLGVSGGLNLYQFNGNNPASFSDPFGLCPNPTAPGLGGLQCVLEDAIGGAKTAIAGAGAAIKSAAAKTVLYAKGNIGAAGAQAEADLSGRAALKGSPSLNTTALSVAAGVRYEFGTAPAYAVEGEVSKTIFAFGKVKISVVGTVAATMEGAQLTSAGIEASVGAKFSEKLPASSEYGGSVSDNLPCIVGNRPGC